MEPNPTVNSSSSAQAILPTLTDDFQILLDAIPIPVFYKDSQGIYTGCNTAFLEYLGRTKEEIIGKSVYDLSSPEQAEIYHRADLDLMASKTTQIYETKVRYADGTSHDVMFTKAVILGADGSVAGLIGTMLDITERKRAEDLARAQLTHQAIIETQSIALRELSTPLLTISETTVVMPLIGAIDGRRAQQAIEALLQGAAGDKVATTIIDITGVSVVDTQIADMLIRATQAVRLLGTQAIITGIRPEVAQTLISLGVSLNGVVTLNSLEQGIAYALKRR